MTVDKLVEKIAVHLDDPVYALKGEREAYYDKLRATLRANNSTDADGALEVIELAIQKAEEQFVPKELEQPAQSWPIIVLFGFVVALITDFLTPLFDVTAAALLVCCLLWGLSTIYQRSLKFGKAHLTSGRRLLLAATLGLASTIMLQNVLIWPSPNGFLAELVPSVGTLQRYTHAFLSHARFPDGMPSESPELQLRNSKSLSEEERKLADQLSWEEISDRLKVAIEALESQDSLLADPDPTRSESVRFEEMRRQALDEYSKMSLAEDLVEAMSQELHFDAKLDRKMTLGERYTVNLVVSSLADGEEVGGPSTNARALLDLMPGENVISETAPAYRNLKASLTSAEMNISERADRVQIVPKNGDPATWSWTIQPLRTGKAFVYFNVVQIVEVDGSIFEVALRNFPRQVDVEVSFLQSLGQTFVWASDKVALLAGLATIITGVIAFLSYRGGKPANVIRPPEISDEKPVKSKEIITPSVDRNTVTADLISSKPDAHEGDVPSEISKIT